MGKRILFISHSSTITGAPKILLSIIKNFRIQNSDWEISIVSYDKGPLFNEFVQYGNVYFLGQFNAFPKTLQEVFNRFYLYFLKVKFWFYDFDIIFCNTVCTLPFTIKLHGRKKICFIHEMPQHFKMYLPDCYSLLLKMDGLITINDEIKENIIENIPEVQSITVINGYYQKSSIVKKDDHSKDFITFGGSGTNLEIKGFKLFSKLAYKLSTEKIKFAWLGINHTIKENEFIICYKETSKPEVVYSKFNCFILTSEIDSFPLAVLENAIIGNPIICFNRGNGIYPLIHKYDAGIVVSNEKEMHAAILYFINNPDELIRKGDNAKQAFMPFSEDMQIAKILEYIQFLS